MSGAFSWEEESLRDWARYFREHRMYQYLPLGEFMTDGLACDLDRAAEAIEELERGCCKLQKSLEKEVEVSANLRVLVNDMYSYARTLGYDHPLLSEFVTEVD